MAQHNKIIIALKVLIIDNELNSPTANGRAAQALISELKKNEVEVIESTSELDGESVFLTDSSIQCVILDWDLSEGSNKDHGSEKRLLKTIRAKNDRIPIFLMTNSEDAGALSAEVMTQADELVLLLEDTSFFLAGRIIAAIWRYRDEIAPPFNKALMSFAQVYEYSWHTPGHTGGTAFLKSPIGRSFYDYFG
jgi:arginine decarboxylase